MKAIEFDEVNITLAKDQPEYDPLPVHIEKGNGAYTACFELTIDELEQITKTGKIWLQQQTFGRPFQPVFLSVNKEDVL